MRALRILTGAVALAALVAPAAHAQNSAEARKLTIMTFSGPVEVPGASLPAGTYRFEMADTQMGSAHAVQVFNEDGSKIITTFLAIPDDRPEPPSRDKTVVMFAERAAGAPQAVKVWFYPGNSIGEEFVYPKDQAVKIAKANHTEVAATEASNTGNDVNAFKNAKVGRVNENGDFSNDEKSASATTAPAATTTAPSSAATTADSSAANQSAQNAPAATAPASTAPRQSNRAVGTAGQANTAPAPTRDTTAQNNNAAPRRRLPQTASQLGVLELLSGLSILGAVSMRRLRRRFAEHV